MPTRLTCALACALLTLVITQAPAQTACSNTKIVVSGAAGTTAQGVNKFDTVVGVYLNNTTFDLGAFRWSAGKITKFTRPNSLNTAFWGINDQGKIAGSYRAQDGRSHGFVLFQGRSAAIDFPNANGTLATGINNSGTVVGIFQSAKDAPFSGFYKNSSGYHVVRFPNAQATQALAISDAGAIAGFYLDAANRLHGFVFFNGTYRAVNFPGASDTMVRGINRAGTLVGVYNPTPNANGVAFRFAGGKFTSYRYPNAMSTSFNGVSNLGDRVGGAVFANSQPGFLRVCR